MGQYIVPAEAKASAEALVKWAKENDVVELDVRFVDVRGISQHVSRPMVIIDAGDFEQGFGFDGSSIKGFQSINASDMLLIADLSTAYIDPFYAHKTLAVKCDIIDPITRQPYPNDPRAVARRAEAYLKETGIADVAYFGPELEFFVFSSVSFEYAPNKASHEVDMPEAFWNSSKKQASYTNRVKEGYFPLPPSDTIQDLRAEMVQTLMAIGIPVEVHHHEVAAAGQCEIDMRFDSLLNMADKMLDYKYVVKNVARKHGMVATFMPKPIFGDNGSGMHVHQSLWKDGQPLFGGSEYAGLSPLALQYVAGVLKHAKALLAITNPSTNSYRRLVPGYEAPVNLVYSARNRSAAIRIPMYSSNPKAKRIETRFPDSMSNPYLCLSALLMAGLDGIKKDMKPPKPVEVDLYEGKVKTETTPPDLGQALQALEADHKFLLEGGVFTKEYLEAYIEFKQREDADAVAMRPHPYEFRLYFDA